MQLYIDTILANPFMLFQAAFAFFAGIAFIIFISGFFGGASHLVTLSENADHLTHARTRAVWGAGWLLILFGLWRLITFVAGLGSTTDLWLAVLLLSPVLISLLFGFLKPKKGGGH